MADKEEMREEYASKAFADALSKHVKVDFEHTFIKGFISFTTTDDLHLTTGYTMHEGLYLLDVRDKGDKIPIEEFVHLKVFAVAYDEEKMLEFVKKAEKANGSNEPVTQEGALKLVPATIDGKPVEFGILPGLYAIQDAKKEDKKKLAETMFGSITEDKQPKKEKQHRNTTKAPDEIAVMNDAVTKAMFGRGEACIQPAAYFNQSMTRVNTGKGGYSNVMVQAPGNTAIDAPFSSYGLSDSDRYWLDAAYSLVKGGNTEFYGSDLLKMNNYKNPWAPSMRKTMNQALYAMMKMKSTLVTVDATNDRRGTKGAAGKIVNRSVGAKSVIECEIFIDEMNDGKNDFTVKLRPPEGSSDPIEAFALSNRAEADHQILKLSTGDSEFKTVKRIDGNEREMWRYVLRRIKEEAFRGTILVDTMFTELALDQQGKSDAAIAKKRTRMIDALRKMLEEKSDPHSPGRLIEGYKFVGADGKLATGMPAKITIRKLKASKDVAGK